MPETVESHAEHNRPDIGVQRRPVKRRNSALALGLPLLLPAAIAGWWLRSYWVTDILGWSNDRRGCSIASSSGQFAVGSQLATTRDPLTKPRPHGYQTSEPMNLAHLYGIDSPEGRWHFFGMILIDQRTPGRRRRALVVPYWQLFLIACAMYASRLHWHAKLRRRERLRAGLCPECGYDLRAGHERCPECGEPVPPMGSVSGR